MQPALELAPAPDCPPWTARGDRLAFRGGCTGPTVGYERDLAPLYLRYRATALTHARPGKFDAGLNDACAETPAPIEGAPNAGLNLSPLPGLDTRAGSCRHKHLLLLDGNAASGRSALWFASGSTVFKPDSVFSHVWPHTRPAFDDIQLLPPRPI